MIIVFCLKFFFNKTFVFVVKLLFIKVNVMLIMHIYVVLRLNISFGMKLALVCIV
jgi:hypothetical protein